MARERTRWAARTELPVGVVAAAQKATVVQPQEGVVQAAENLPHAEALEACHGLAARGWPR